MIKSGKIMPAIIFVSICAMLAMSVMVSVKGLKSYSTQNNVVIEKSGIVVRTELLSSSAGLIAIDTDGSRVVIVDSPREIFKYIVGDTAHYTEYYAKNADGSKNEDMPSKYRLVR